MVENWAYIDFEFNESSEKHPNLVCCCITTVDTEYGKEHFDFWLHYDAQGKHSLIEKLLQLQSLGFVFVAYAAEAEARCFLALGLNPTTFKWLDLFLEYRCLLNQNHSLAYGKQLIKGKEVFTRAPSKNKYSLSEEELLDVNKSKPEDGLAAAVFKLLGKKIDTAFKDSVRSLILSKPAKFTDEEQRTIVEYCRSDIECLSRLREAQLKEYFRLTTNCREERRFLFKEMLSRGEYAARSAKMVSSGYPIDIIKTRAFVSRVTDILASVQTEINELFPSISPFTRGTDYQYSWSQTRTREWIFRWLKANPGKRWMLTKGKKYSLALAAWERNFHFRHTYPKDNFGAQMLRYLRIKQNLHGFVPKKGGKSDERTFWDAVGSDNRVRPYFNIYGSQSARSQPSSISFIPLKSAWMRVLISPRPGRAICGIDYSSQEFLLAALLSGDKAMLAAYESGDPYLWFGKASGGIPKDGTKKTHSTLRNAYKSTTLGLQYGMGDEALAGKISQDTGQRVTKLQANKYSSLFWKVFRGYGKYNRDILFSYNRYGHIKLPCGWYMWGDNDNERSVKNVPVQGAGSSIMRRAVARAQDMGLEVIFTLHDAIYIEFDSDKLNDSVCALAQAMDMGFRDVFQHSHMKDHANIRLEASVWSPDYLEEKEILMPYSPIMDAMPTTISTLYIDERAAEEYEQFKGYLEPLDYDSIEI